MVLLPLFTDCVLEATVLPRTSLIEIDIVVDFADSTAMFNMFFTGTG